VHTSLEAPIVICSADGFEVEMTVRKLNELLEANEALPRYAREAWSYFVSNSDGKSSVLALTRYTSALSAPRACFTHPVHLKLFGKAREHEPNKISINQGKTVERARSQEPFCVIS
jgi:hypothetical protein